MVQPSNFLLLLAISAVMVQALPLHPRGGENDDAEDCGEQSKLNAILTVATPAAVKTVHYPKCLLHSKSSHRPETLQCQLPLNVLALMLTVARNQPRNAILAIVTPAACKTLHHPKALLGYVNLRKLCVKALGACASTLATLGV